ncbi:MAG: hypothetical protein HW421_2452 [Ignavibacteria bacterium]|nr:hypothetical protein [Ignavibacteria bacterium]
MCRFFFILKILFGEEMKTIINIVIIGLMAISFSFADGKNEKNKKEKLLDITTFLEAHSPICAGQSLRIDSYGIPETGCTYKWDGPGGFSSAEKNILIPAATIANAGLYRFKVTCPDYVLTDSVYFVVIGTIEANIIATPPQICEGDTVTLTASPSWLYYEWLSGETTQSIKITKPGKYRVRVYVQNCEDWSSAIDINVVPKPDASILSNGSLTFCTGDSVTLIAKPDTIGSMYLWSTGERTQKIIARKSGKYRVTVSNADGCTDTSSVFVKTIPIEMGIAPLTKKLCEGDSTKLFAWPTGGGYKYKWFGSMIDSVITDSVIMVSKTGTYYCEVENLTGCKGTDSIYVFFSPHPEAKIISDGPTHVCIGTNVKLKSSTRIPKYKYYWSVGVYNYEINATQTGYYELTVIDTNGCSNRDSIYVRFNQRPIVNIVTDKPFPICQGDSVILTTKDIYARYKWSTGDTSSSIVVKRYGDFQVQVTDSVGCTGAANILILVDTIPIAKILSPDSFCSGDSITLSSERSFAYYRWSTGDTSSSIIIKNEGKYTLTVGDINKCWSLPYEKTVIKLPLPEIKIIAPQRFCPGETIKLSADRDFPSYTWSTGESTKEILVSVPGLYKLEVKSESGCIGKTTINLEYFHPVITFDNFANTDIGRCLIGADTQKSFEIINNSEDIFVESLSLKSGLNTFTFNSLPIAPVLIGKDSKMDFDVKFKPTVPGIFIDSIILDISQPCRYHYAIALKGTGVSKVIFSLPDTSGIPGTQDFCLPVRAKINYQTTDVIKLNYTGEISIEANAFLPDASYAGVIENGIRRIPIEGTEHSIISNESQLFSICGMILLPDKIKTSINYSKFEWQNSLVDIDTINGSLSVKNICNLNLRLIKSYTPLKFSIQPNPASDETSIVIDCSDKGSYSYKLYSITGALIQMSEWEMKAVKETYRVSLESVPSGVYRLVITSPVEQTSANLFIVK